MNREIGLFIDDNCDKCKKGYQKDWKKVCTHADLILLALFGGTVPERTLEFIDGLDSPCPHFEGR